MAFSFIDASTGKSVFDVAEETIIARKADGTTVEIFKNGALVIGAAQTYTDAKAVAALKAKPQIVALTASSDIAAVVAALKA